MTTRSQALAKRKAEEQLPGSQHPAKSSKSGASDDSSSSRRKQGVSQRADKSRKDRGDVESEDLSEKAKETVPQKSAPASRSGEVETGGSSTPAQTESPKTAENGAVETPGAHDEPPTDTSEDRARQEEDQTNRRLAVEVMQLSQLIVERWRLSDGPAMPTSHDDKQLESIADLCDLLTRREDTHLNPFLTRFPPFWFDDMRDLKQRLEQLEKSRKQLAEATKKVEHCSATYDMAVSKRGDSYVGAGDRSQEARQILRDAVRKAREPYLEALKNWYEAQERSEELKSRTWSMILHVLPTAEKTLVCDGYLRHWRGDHSVAPSEDGSQDGAPPPDEESLRTPTHVRYVSGLGRSGSQRRTKSPLPGDRQERRERTSAQNQSRERHQEEDESVEKEDIIADLYHEQRGELDRARVAYERALDKFDAVRNRYYGDLAKFVSKQQKSTVRGTRTDFDHKYFVMRNRANREVTAARNALESAIEEADMTGALTLGQRILLFRDEADSQRVEGENPLTRMLRETSNERIESWRNDEAQKDIVSKNEWSDLLSEPKQEGDSIGSVDEPECEEYLATGKRRRDIDQWQRQQRKDRSETAFAVLPSMFPKGAEVQWFEGVDGI